MIFEENSAVERAREASLTREIRLAPRLDISLAVCRLEIILPFKSILLARTGFIVDQVKGTRLAVDCTLPSLCC